MWVFRLELKQSRLADRRWKPRSMALHKSVALLTRAFQVYRRIASFSSFRKAISRGAGRFSGPGVSGVMQSVPMPITKPGAARCGGGRRDMRRRDVILWSGADLPARACINWLTARLVETGIKHARLRVYAPRRPNFSSERSLPGVFVPRRTPREYATTGQRRGDEVTRTSSIVNVIRSWLTSRDGRTDVETPGSATLLPALAGQSTVDRWHVFAQILLLTLSEMRGKHIEKMILHKTTFSIRNSKLRDLIFPL